MAESIPPATLDPERYVPAFLTLLARRWSATASRDYRNATGLGVTEWSVMSQIAIAPFSPATRICLLTGLDKAAVSRSIATLARSGLLRLDTTGGDREAVLTPDGERVHAQLLGVALQREERLLAGLSEADRSTLRGLLTRMIANLPSLGRLPEQMESPRSLQ